MKTSKLRAHLKNEIEQIEGELLGQASMFLYNWTEGSWTPPPLTDEQITEITRRAEEVEQGEAEMISMEKFQEELEERYGYVRDDSEEYRVKREQEEKEDLIQMLDEINHEHLIWFQIFLESRRLHTVWNELPEEAMASIQRGKADVVAGRYSDAFDYLKKHG